MYVMTRQKNEEDNVVFTFINSPRFDIDEVRRIKALIRFKLGKIVSDKEDVEAKNITTIMKFGRCTSISTINNALYGMSIRLAGKEQDTIYKFTTTYNEGKIDITFTDIYNINKYSKEAF